MTAMRSTFRDTELALQEGSEVARQPVGVGISQRLVEAADGWLVGEPLHRLLEHLQHGAIGVRVDLCWNSLAIRGEPVLVRHFLLPPVLYTNAPNPVMARPTTSVLISRVPS